MTDLLRPVLLPVVLLVASLAMLSDARPASARELPLAFVKKHCWECHNKSTTEGDFRADLLGNEVAEPTSHQAWTRVLARVQSGEMPPPQETERPAAAEVSAALTASGATRSSRGFAVAATFSVRMNTGVAP